MSVRIIVYFRNPLDFTVSSYKQWIKTGHFSGTFREFVPRVQFLLDYKSLVERWESGFGKDSVHVRMYDKVKTSPGLINDFLVNVDESFRSDPAITDSRVALSPSDRDTKVMLMLNQVGDRLELHSKAQRTIGRIRHKVWNKTKIGQALSAVTGSFLTGQLVRESDVDFLRAMLQANGAFMNLQSYVSVEDMDLFTF